MSLWIGLFSLHIAFAGSDRADLNAQARERMKQAQLEYLAGDSTAMMKTLTSALEIQNDDPVLNRQAVEFSKQYFSTAKTPEAYFEFPKHILSPWTILHHWHKVGEKSPFFRISVSFKTMEPKKVRRVFVRTPDGRTLRAFDETFQEEAETFLSQDPPNSYVFLTMTEQSDKILLPGLYTVTYEIEGRPTFHHALILDPDPSPAILPAVRYASETGKIHWQAPLSSTYLPSMDRGINANIKKSWSAMRSLWMTGEELKDIRVTSGEMAPVTKPGNYVLNVSQSYMKNMGNFLLIYDYGTTLDVSF